MPTYTPQTAKFSKIARAVRRRIADAVVADPNTGRTLDPSYVRFAASDEYKAGSVAEPFWVLVRVFGPRFDTDAGAGRRARPVTRLLRVFCITRSSLDPYASDVEALAADETGLFDREEAVAESLDDWFPWELSDPGDVTSDPAALTIEPLHPVEASDPPVRLPIDDQGVIWSHLDYEVRYLLRVTPTDPPE